MVVVMPYFPKDLKRVLKSTRKHGEVFQDARAVRVMYHLLLAVRHLKAHAIVHRDIKLDNVLLANVGMEEEAAVLTDFGMCFGRIVILSRFVALFVSLIQKVSLFQTC